MYTALTGNIPTGTNFVLTRAQVFLDDPEVLFDEVTIGRQQPLTSAADMCKCRKTKHVYVNVIQQQMNILCKYL